MSDAAVETTSLTIELPRETVDRLNALAECTTGTVADLIGEAIAERLSYLEWKLAKVQEAIDDMDAGVPGIPHEKVMAWIESWGKPDELPIPE